MSLDRICLFEKRVWGSEPANSRPSFPSHTLHVNSRHLICLEIPVAAGLSSIREVQGDGGCRASHRCPLSGGPVYVGVK